MKIFLLIFALINVTRGQGGLGVNIMDFMGPNGVDLVAFQKAMEEAAARLAQESAQAAAQLAREEERKSSEAAIEEAEKRTRDEERQKAEREKEEALKKAEEEKQAALETAQREKQAALESAQKEKEAALEAERKEARRQRIIAIRKARKEAREAALAAKTAPSTTTTTSTTTSTTTTSTTTSTTKTTTTTTTKSTTTTKRPTTRGAPRTTRPRVTRPALVKLDPEIFGKYRYCRKCVGETAEDCIKANRLETCRNPSMTCHVNFRRTHGVAIFRSGCMKLDECQNHERQNMGSAHGARNIYTMQCRPGWVLPGRPSTCTFCHKMGTWEKTHLLFQNDTIGTNDPNGILGYSSFQEIFAHPLKELRPNTALSKQKWYMNAPPSY